MISNPSSRTTIASLLAAALVASSSLPAREFKSTDGSKSIEAEIVSVDSKGGSVTLRKPDGSIFEAPISAFSQDDRAFISQHGLESTPVADQIARLDEIAESRSNFAKTANEILPLLVEKTHPAVRRHASRAAGSVPSSDLIPPLIASIRDRVVGIDSRDSLIRLTGEDLGKDPSDWERWWEKNRETFRPKCLTLRELASLRAKENRKKPDPDPETPLFYGRELTGKNILFLLDISGSMEGDRLDRLKMELRSMVELLPAECSFAFIFFPHRVFPEADLGSAEPDFKEETYKVIAALEAGGGTPMGRAIETAFEYPGRGEPVDTIYLLGDGEPTDLSGLKIRRLVSEKNADHHVAIHTIAIGDDSDLLKSIAAENEGVHLWSATKAD